MSGFPSYYIAADPTISKSVREKLKKGDDFYQSFLHGIGVGNVLRFNSRKQKNLKKIQKYLEKNGKKEELERFSEIDQKLVALAKNPAYSREELGKLGEDEAKKLKMTYEKQMEANENRLRQKIYETLPYVKIERTKRLGFLPSKKVVFELDNCYEDLFQNATLKSDKHLVHKGLEKIEASEKDPEKRLKIKELKRLYAKKEKVHRKKIWGGALACLAAGAFAGTLYLASASSNDEEEYAEKMGISSTLAQKIKNIDNDNDLDMDEKALIDYVSTLSKDQQEKVIDGFVADGSFSLLDYQQVQFMASLPKEEQIEHIEDGSFVNPDWDRDVMGTNWFEKFVSKTPYDVPNNTYAVVMTLAGHEHKDIREMFDSLEDIGIPEGNVYDLSSEGNNSEDFQAAVQKIAKIATKNDNVIFIIDGDGTESGRFCFKDGEFVSYDWMAEKINEIPAKTIISLETCYSGTAIKSLEKNDRLLLTAGNEEQEVGFGLSNQLLSAFSKRAADTNGDNSVNIREAAEYAKIMKTSDSTTPQLSDPGNIGSGYIAEIIIED